MNKEKLSWEEYALALAFTASMRSEDPYVKVGACALRHDNSVAGLGYNGAPPDIEIDWSDRDQRRIKVIHAETNCLGFCTPGEVRLLAVTMLPCPSCMTQIARHRIKKVIYRDLYDKDQQAINLAKEFKIELVQIPFNFMDILRLLTQTK